MAWMSHVLTFRMAIHAEHKHRLEILESVREELGIPIASLLDTKGPEIRTGKLKDGKKVTLKEGDLYTLTTEEIVGDETRGYINYAGLAEDVKPGDRILIERWSDRAARAGGQWNRYRLPD